MNWKRLDGLVQPATILLASISTGGCTVSPSSCLQNAAGIENLVSCLDTFTVPHNYYNAATYDLAQPDDIQRHDWTAAIQSLLSVDGDCGSVPIPMSLQGLYTIEQFGAHCVLYETTSEYGTFLKGWGCMIVPARLSSVSRTVHISAPHPGYDLGTVEQAAAVYEMTGAKSLLVAGRTRTAFRENSTCIAPTSPSQDYYKTDPAHNNEEPFFDANMAIQGWQYESHGGCPSSSCGFLQMHGKGARTCSEVGIFLSSGLGNSTASKRWYADDTDRPIKRLHQHLQEQFPDQNVSLPTSSDCVLTATKNVVGRALNGIAHSAVCNTPATPSNASGMFLHAEQASAFRSADNYQAWARAVSDTFEMTCAVGMIEDTDKQLCIPSFDMPSAWTVILTEPRAWSRGYCFFLWFLC